MKRFMLSTVKAFSYDLRSKFKPHFRWMDLITFLCKVIGLSDAKGQSTV